VQRPRQLLVPECGSKGHRWRDGEADMTPAATCYRGSCISTVLFDMAPQTNNLWMYLGTYINVRRLDINPADGFGEVSKLPAPTGTERVTWGRGFADCALIYSIYAR
jgi:hypothetical protein